MTAPADPKPDISAAATTPAAENGENGDAPPQQMITVPFPAFDIFAARAAQTKKVRLPNDRSMDHAYVFDVNYAASYAKQCAALAAIEVVNASQNVMIADRERRISETVAMLANVIDQAIITAINQYDAWKKEQAWYRRVGRWWVAHVLAHVLPLTRVQTSVSAEAPAASPTTPINPFPNGERMSGPGGITAPAERP